jgi:hypothetical protein
VGTWGTPREEARLLGHVDLVNYLGMVELEAGTINGYLRCSFGLRVSVNRDWTVQGSFLKVKLDKNTCCGVSVLCDLMNRFGLECGSVYHLSSSLKLKLFLLQICDPFMPNLVS